MITLYIHFSWAIFIGLIFFVRLFLSLYVSFNRVSLFFSFPLFGIWNNYIEVRFYFDFISSWFRTIILLISTVIMVYSYNYISPYNKSVYFLWFTVLFVVSMLFVVSISNLFFIMLGWDGLGLVSFFLIVYYQNPSSVMSGSFTLLMNRIGDSFFLLRISFVYYFYNDMFSFSSEVSSFLLTIFLVITFITKRAIYPFSPWLPLAMAAPTPISALVHSSTLVTAGLYLMLRYSYLLYSSYFCIKLLLVVSLFTSFYAGMNSLFEKDLKKLIALSTLSHLGFIGLAFSAGLLQLAFFHILTHALFKSLLFMTIGDIILNLNHSQDIRYLSSGIIYTPISCYIMFICLFNLLGLPRLSGFYSKDLILEMMNFSSIGFFINLVLFINVFFTYFYTYQLFYYSFQPNKLNPYQLLHSPMLCHTLLLTFMGIITLVFGFIFTSMISPFLIFYPIPSLNKFLPLIINFSFFFSLVLFLKQFRIRSKWLTLYFSNIMGLSSIMLTFSSNIYFYRVTFLVKSFESGFLGNSLSNHVGLILSTFSQALLRYSMYSPLQVILLSSFFCLLIFIVWIDSIFNMCDCYSQAG